jgi:hypothetical protein
VLAFCDGFFQLLQFEEGFTSHIQISPTDLPSTVLSG